MSETETSLQVLGMSCASCVRHVGAALQEVRGVSKVDVRLTEGKVQVRHDSQTPVESLIEAVVEAGYEARATTG
jgi:copper chaperone